MIEADDKILGISRAKMSYNEQPDVIMKPQLCVC